MYNLWSGTCWYKKSSSWGNLYLAYYCSERVSSFEPILPRFGCCLNSSDIQDRLVPIAYGGPVLSFSTLPAEIVLGTRVVVIRHLERGSGISSYYHPQAVKFAPSVVCVSTSGPGHCLYKCDNFSLLLQNWKREQPKEDLNSPTTIMVDNSCE